MLARVISFDTLLFNNPQKVMSHPLTIVFQTFALLGFVLCTTFALWALLFGMTITGMLGLLLIPLWMQPWLQIPLPKFANPFGLLIVLITWPVGWEEYKRERINLSCQVHQIYHRLHSDIPNWCPNQYQQPLDDWKETTLFKPSQRFAILMHHFAEASYFSMIGWSTKADQLFRFHTASPPKKDLPRVPKKMRGRCSPSGYTSGTTVSRQSSRLQHSTTWTSWYTSHKSTINTLGHWEPFQDNLTTTYNPPPSHSETEHLLRSYAQVFLEQSVHSRSWRIQQPQIHTPQPAYQWSPPFSLTDTIPLDDAMYCGLHMIGWLHPYRETWSWIEEK